MSATLKQGIVIALCGIGMLGAIGALVHRRKLSFGFGFGWVAVSLAVVSSSLLTPVVDPIARQFSMTGTAVFLVVAVALLVAVCVQLSISVSSLQSGLQDLAEANALLRAELESGRTSSGSS
jgi:uncharacterized membrane protein YqjE